MAELKDRIILIERVKNDTQRVIKVLVYLDSKKFLKTIFESKNGMRLLNRVTGFYITYCSRGWVRKATT